MTEEESDWDNRQFSPEDIPEQWMRELFKATESEKLHADPHSKFPLACILSSVLAGSATTNEKAAAAQLLLESFTKLSPERFAQFSKELLELKMFVEQSPHRNSRALAAYGDFVEQAGREPSKPDLKDFILARSEVYGIDWPGREQPWTRIWQSVGLSGLSRT